MKIRDVAEALEQIAPPSLQESYDNSGLLIGEPNTEVRGILTCLDCTEAILDEAIQRDCNLVVAHHPLIFKGLKRLNGKNYTERAVIKAVRSGISVYAIHTNLDNVLYRGVNSKIAERLGLRDTAILQPMGEKLAKLTTFVPIAHAEEVRAALFQAGAGHIGRYDACSFNIEGTGTFRANEGANPFTGQLGSLHREAEMRIEVILALHQQDKVINALKQVHPYEEVAFYLSPLLNEWQAAGAGIIGRLPESLPPDAFLAHLKQCMELKTIRFTEGKNIIQSVAVCGGSGSFLIGRARQCGADAYISADIKYHEFFDGEATLMVCDIGHYESEKYTTSLLQEILQEKFPNFAVLLPGTETNPVRYYH